MTLYHFSLSSFSIITCKPLMIFFDRKKFSRPSVTSSMDPASTAFRRASSTASWKRCRSSNFWSGSPGENPKNNLAGWDMWGVRKVVRVTSVKSLRVEVYATWSVRNSLHVPWSCFLAEELMNVNDANQPNFSVLRCSFFVYPSGFAMKPPPEVDGLNPRRCIHMANPAQPSAFPKEISQNIVPPLGGPCSGLLHDQWKSTWYPKSQLILNYSFSSFLSFLTPEKYSKCS